MPVYAIKISEMPAVVTATGPELIEVVQGSVSKKMTLDAVTGFTAVNASATAASASAAITARDAAIAAASAAGPVAIYQTYALADAATGLSVGDVVEVMIDETRANSRTRYVVDGGGDLDYVLTLPRMIGVTPVRGPDDYDDTASIQAAIDAAGVGGLVTLMPGVTYTVSARCTMLDRQTLDLCGATVKMCDQVQTTTTQAVTSATTSFTVADASAFRVGMAVVLAKAGVARASLVYQTSLSTSDARITDISGNTITISTTLNITGTFASGSTLVNAYIPIMHASLTTLRDGTLDGNRANRPWARWEVDYLSEFPIGSFGCTIERVRLQNAPGEGVGWFGNGHRVINCKFLTLGGNGVHFSDAVHPLVHGCWFESGNLDTAVGHVNGAVAWSNGITHATITDNYCTGFMAGIGSFDETDTDATITGNTITGNKVWGVYVAAGAARLVLANNRITNNRLDPSLVAGLGYSSTGGVFFNSVTGSDYLLEGNQIDEAGAPYALYTVGTGAAKRLSISNSQIVGHVLLGGVSNTVVTDSHIKGKVSLDSADGLRLSDTIIDLAGDTSAIAVSLYGSAAYRDVMLSGLTIRGGVYGISVSTSATEISDVRIADCLLQDQSNRGISITNTAAAVRGLSVTDCLVATGPSSVAGYSAILANPAKVTLARNIVENEGGLGAGSRIAINYSAAAGAGAGGVIQDNIVRGDWANAIALAANAGAWVINNVVDSGTVGSATGNTISGTVTI